MNVFDMSDQELKSLIEQATEELKLREELAPCPICHKKPSFWYRGGDSDGHVSSKSVVECTDCGLRVEVYPSFNDLDKHGAFRAWNNKWKDKVI